MDAHHIAVDIVKRLKNAGFETYFAGGWVRDHLLGTDRLDIDIATKAAPEEVQALFPKTVAVGAQFGVIIICEGPFQFEVASFRRDGLYVDGRRPETISYSTAQEDVARRDFTINGMFYDPLTETIYDWVGGQEDLKDKIIRAIGDPAARFEEDRLRMIRAVRIACRLGFTLEEKTEEAIRAAAHTLFPSVAKERIYEEFKKMGDSPTFGKALALLQDLGLLQQIFPAISSLTPKEIEKLSASFALMPKGTPFIAKVEELFPQAALEEQVERIQELKGSRKEIQLLTLMHKARELLRRNNVEQIEWIRFYAEDPALFALKIVLARGGDVLGPLKEHEERLVKYKEAVNRIQTRRPLLSAERLRKEGIPNSPLMGRLLAEGERLAVNQDLQGPEQVLEQLKDTPLWVK
jgi:poly(A) polymerase